MGRKNAVRFFGTAFMSLALCIALSAGVVASGAAATEKTGNASVFYAVITVFSFLLVFAYLLWEKNKDKKFFFLYSCVAVANLGYFLISVSNTLAGALWANRIGYFGSAYAVLTMLFIVAEVCHFRLCGTAKVILFTVTTASFLFAATGGWLNIYYLDVSLEFVNGVSILHKSYAPLHILYTVYVVLYFAVMVAMIVAARKRGALGCPGYAVFLGAVVLGNIAVWGVEQLIHIEFEFLSISYILTEFFLLLLRGVISEYERRVEKETQLRLSLAAEDKKTVPSEQELPPNVEELFNTFSKRVELLTPTERSMLQYYIDGYTLVEIAEKSYISINTAKKHNSNLRRKLELKSREELSLYIDLFRRVGRLDEIEYKRK